MHPLQARQGLQPNNTAAHRQVAAFHQRQAQVAGEICLLIIGFVVGPRRQQDDQRRLTTTQRYPAVARALAPPMGQAGAQGGEEARQVLNLQVAQQIREGPRDHCAVFQGITGTRRRLGAVRYNPPLAIGRAGQIDGVKMQGHVARMAHAMGWAQKTGMPVDQGTGQQAFLQQALLAIHIAKNLIEQRGALDHRCLDSGPLGVGQNQRQHVQVPGPLNALGVGIHVVGHAVLAHLAVHCLQALAH